MDSDNEINKNSFSLNNFNLENLEDIKNKINIIISEFNSLFDKMYDYKKIFYSYTKNLLLEIDDDINFLKANDLYKNEQNKNKIFKEIKSKYNDYYENTSFIYNNNYIKEIINQNENINYILNDLIEFSTSSIDSVKVHLDDEDIMISPFNEISKINESQLKKYSHFYDSLNENEENIAIEDKYKIISSDEDSEKISFKCSICNSNQIKSYCECCNKIFCEKCSKDIANITSDKEHDIKIIEVLPLNIEQNEEKILFLNSIPIFLKQFFLRCNYLLNNDILNLNKSLFKEKNNEDYLKIQILKNIFKYPFISDEIDFNDCVQFLNEINAIFIHKYNDIILQNNSFYISGINSMILNSVKPILNDDKIKLIDDEYSSFSESEQKSLNNIVNELRTIIIIYDRPGKSTFLNILLSSYIENQYLMKIVKIIPLKKDIKI